MNEREVLKLTLAALKQIDEAMPFPVAKLAIMEAEKALAQPEQNEDAIIIEYHEATIKRLRKRIAELEAQLAQPAVSETHKQEPVTLPCCGYTDASAIKWNPYNQVVQCHNCGHVYTTPPQRTWVGLTDEEIWENDSYKVAITDQETRWLYRFARAIEAKLKEKNT